MPGQLDRLAVGKEHRNGCIRKDAGGLKGDVAGIDDLVRRIARHHKRCVRSKATHLSIEMPFTPASTDQYDSLAVVAMRRGRAAGRDALLPDGEVAQAVVRPCQGHNGPTG